MIAIVFFNWANARLINPLRHVRLGWLLFLVFALYGGSVTADNARFSLFGNSAQIGQEPLPLAAGISREGTLHLGSTISFDSTNLMRFPGRAPSDIRKIFDTLLVRRHGEIGFYEGLLAKTLEVGPDFEYARIGLDPAARWHDGEPITADDVTFTFETLRKHGLPLFRTTLKNIEITAEGPLTILFENPEPGNWRYIDLIGTFPIQSRAFWQERDPSKTTLEAPMGSGPYRLKELEFDRRMVLERAEDYWAKTHPLNQGKWNFDRVVVDYFFDENALIEAVKRGEVDFKREWSPQTWLNRYAGPAMREGRLVRTTLQRTDAGSMNMLVFNQRRPPLDDIRVRRALALVFDTEWFLDTLGGVFEPPGSYYGQTDFAASGALTAGEEDLLARFDPDLSERIGNFDPTSRVEKLSRRERLRRASALLDDAGFAVVDGRRINPLTGAPFEITYVTAHKPTADRLDPYRKALEALGVTLKMSVHDIIVGQRLILDHEYDLTWLAWQAAFPPGAQENYYWNSDQADQQGYGLAGLQSADADFLIETMQSARDLDTIKASTKLLDRLLRSGHYTIPLWQSNDIGLVHDARLAFPENSGSSDPIRNWWWKSE